MTWFVRVVAIVALVAGIAVAVPAAADSFWLSVFTTGVIFILPVAGCGLLYGRLGIVALHQVALLGVGTWVTLRVGFATGLSFPVLVLCSGFAAAAIGVIIGLPALRLSRLDFALLTLMAAGAAEVLFTAIGFPNGGRGFTGVKNALESPRTFSRPAVGTSDPAYFRYVVVVVALMCFLVWLHTRTRPGRAWAVIREGFQCAQSVGINPRVYVTWAVALSCFITGAGGALLAAQIGTASPDSFHAATSVTTFAVALLGGVYSIPGYVIGGIGAQAIPGLIQQLGANADVALVVFGVGLLSVLVTAPGGTAGQLRDLANAFASNGRGLMSAARSARGSARDS